MLITGFAAPFLLAYHFAQMTSGIKEEWEYKDLRLSFFYFTWNRNLDNAKFTNMSIFYVIS